MLFSKKDLRRLMVPLVFEQLLNVAIGMVDTIMVASVGEAAVSGVSLVDSINLLLVNLFSALATGGAVVTAQYLGRRQPDQASRAAKQLFYVVLLFSSAIMAVCLLFRFPMLKLIFGTVEADVMRNAEAYFLFTAISYPFLGMYNASAALLRSMSNAKASLQTSIIMNVTNIIGNAILIYGFGMGAAGAAIATLFSRMVGAAVMQLALRRPECAVPYPVLHQFEWAPGLVRKILQIGVPSGLEGGMFQFGKLGLLGLISTFGTVSIAANAVGNSLSTLQVLPGSAIGLAMITVVGQCVGAGAFDQARMYTRKLMRMAYLSMGIFNLLLIAGMRIAILPFNLSPQAAELAWQLLVLHGAGCIFLWPFAFVLPNALRAAGDTVFVMTVSTLSMLTFRVISGFVLAKLLGLGVLGVWIAMQIDWVCRIICFELRFRGSRWLTKAVV